MTKELTTEQVKKIKRAENIVLIFLIIFVIWNISVFMRFLLSHRP